jgi:hypothetical protein
MEKQTLRQQCSLASLTQKAKCQENSFLFFSFFFLLPELTDYVHQEFPIKLAGAGDRLGRESGAWND